MGGKLAYQANVDKDHVTCYSSFNLTNQDGRLSLHHFNLTNQDGSSSPHTRS